MQVNALKTNEKKIQQEYLWDNYLNVMWRCNTVAAWKKKSVSFHKVKYIEQKKPILLQHGALTEYCV